MGDLIAIAEQSPSKTPNCQISRRMVVAPICAVTVAVTFLAAVARRSYPPRFAARPIA